MDLVGDPIVLRVPQGHGNRGEDEDEGQNAHYNPLHDDHSPESLALVYGPPRVLIHHYHSKSASVLRSSWMTACYSDSHDQT